MRTYRQIDGQKLTLEERILTVLAQIINYHTSCSYLGEINRCVYDDPRSIEQTLASLENQGWVRWERACGLNNIHFASYKLRKRYQQHPVKLVRAYRKSLLKGV